MVQKAYSRDQELEADAVRRSIAAQRRVGPAGRGDRDTRKLSEQGGDRSGLASYFSTHPPMDCADRSIRQLLQK